MSTARKIDIQQLSQSERILLAEQLWDSVAKDNGELEVTEAHKEILKQRLASYRASPDEGRSWEEIKDEMK